MPEYFNVCQSGIPLDGLQPCPACGAGSDDNCKMAPAVAELWLADHPDLAATRLPVDTSVEPTF